MAAATRVEAVVIGAGVIGLAVARAMVLASPWKEVLVLERNDAASMETSSRNSEVVHAGLYYPADSNKARWCVEGRHRLYEYCRERNIAVNRCGKLVVATCSSDTSQAARIESLHRQALRNGVSDVRLLDRSKVLELEPQLSPAVAGALWSPSTGAVDSHALMQHLWADAQRGSGDDGDYTAATLAVRSPVTEAGLDPATGRVQLRVDDVWLDCDVVVNCAGLWADGIARSIHQRGRTAWQPPRQYFCKGTYFRLEGGRQPKPDFSHLIYPLPDPRGGLGIHATLSAKSGSDVKFGPDVEWLSIDQDPDLLDYRPDPNRADSFYDSIRQYWPDLADGSLVPDFAGVRPKLWHPDVASDSPPASFHDFVCAGPRTHRVPGLVHLLGMESPGLTASLAVADFVVQELRRSAT